MSSGLGLARLDSALFTFPLLSKKECAEIISLAEEHAAGMGADGWTTARHAAYRTTDIAVRESPTLMQALSPVLGE